MRGGENNMTVQYFRDILYRILDTSDKLKIASITVDCHENHTILVELEEGDKFEVSVQTTERAI